MVAPVAPPPPPPPTSSPCHVWGGCGRGGHSRGGHSSLKSAALSRVTLWLPIRPAVPSSFFSTAGCCGA
ncbi:unnamed protein product [Closterium sp. NIES-54]